MHLHYREIVKIDSTIYMEFSFGCFSVRVLVSMRRNATRTFLGTFMGFDKHMNLLLDNATEYRKVRQKFTETEAAIAKEEAIELPKMKQEKRELGFIILRGEQVISMFVDTIAPTGKDLNFM